MQLGAWAGQELDVVAAHSQPIGQLEGELEETTGRAELDERDLHLFLSSVGRSFSSA